MALTDSSTHGGGIGTPAAALADIVASVLTIGVKFEEDRNLPCARALKLEGFIAWHPNNAHGYP